MVRGLVIVFTGHGKGKTSAALGIALRATGHKMFVSIVQFIKGDGATGEALASERLAPELEFVSLGKGFVDAVNPHEDHRKAAEAALLQARQRMLSGSWDILVLDEINVAVSLGLIPLAEVMALVRDKPPKLHLILTGRDAHPELIAVADMATEMRCLKHPFDIGVPALRGVDF